MGSQSFKQDGRVGEQSFAASAAPQPVSGIQTALLVFSDWVFKIFSRLTYFGLQSMFLLLLGSYRLVMLTSFPANPIPYAEGNWKEWFTPILNKLLSSQVSAVASGGFKVNRGVGWQCIFLLTLFKIINCIFGKTKHFPLFWVLAFQLWWEMVIFARLACFLLPTSSWQCLNDYRGRHVPELPCKLRSIRRQKQDGYLYELSQMSFSF